MPETTKTATPRRRTAAKATAKPAPKAAAPVEPEDEPTRLTITLGSPVAETKRYTKFDSSKDDEGNDTGMAGSLYVPLGTETVRIALIGPASVLGE